VRRLYLILLLYCFAAVVPAAAQQRSKQQKIERILELTNPDTVVTEVVNQVDGMMKQIRPNPTPQQKNRQQVALEKIAKISKERMLKIRPELVKAYADTFSDEEIDGILAFYETAAGRAAVTKIPAINARMSGLIQSEMNALGPEINKIAEDALKP
jgi:uncharacterized protein